MLNDLFNLPTTLSAGVHDGPEDGFCVMELTGYLAGEPWSDTPECVDGAICALAQYINDRDRRSRERLMAYVPALTGTRCDDRAQARLDVAIDHLKRWIPQIEARRGHECTYSALHMHLGHGGHPVPIEEAFRLLDQLIQMGPNGGEVPAAEIPQQKIVA